MKFNFRKISAIGASLLMAGMTAGIAAAATYPTPFVDNGVADVAIVYGTGAGVSTLDSVEAGNIQTNLGTFVTGTGNTTVTGGDSVKLERDPTNFFNLGEDMNDFYTSLDEEQLSEVLAKGVYTNDINDEFEYEQKITLGSNLVFEHFADSDLNDDVPTLGFKQASGDNILTYTLDFTDAAENTVNLGEGTATNPDTLETTTLTILGTEYYISKVDYTSNGAKLTLLDTANSAVITEGESSTVAGHTVSVEYLGESEVKLNIDGEITNSLSETGTYKLSDGTYVSIIDIMYSAKDSGISKVEISLGTGKIVLENGLEVEMNGDAISDIPEYEGNELTATIVNSTTTSLDSISLAWTLDDDAYLVKDGELVLPGFETIKISMGEFNVPLEEITSVNADGDDSSKLETTIKDGDVSLNLVYLNSGSTAIEGLGEKATHKLVTNATSGTTSASPTRVRLNESENSYFVATWISGDDAESYAFEIGSITEGSSHTNKTTIKNLVVGASDKTFSEVGDDVDAGQMSFNLTASDDDTGMVTIDISATSGTVYTDRIMTAEGMQILLPVDSLTSTADQFINVTAGTDTSFGLNVTEEDVDGNIASGPTFLMNFTVDSAEGIEVLSLSNMTTLETADDSNVYEGYMVSPLATKVMHDKPTSGLNDLDIIYHGSETNVDVYVAESSVMLSTGGASTLGNVLVLDSEVSSVSDKNLIVVGGSCINSAAAALVGEAACSERFTELTGVGMGQFLVKGYASSSITDKLAVLVAGYDAADTQNAATYLTTQTVDTSSEYIGTDGSHAELQVTTA